MVTARKKAKKANPGGRPPKYRQQYADQAREMCRLGGSDRSLAKAFGVSVSTVVQWRKDREEFATACREGKDEFDADKVEAALHKRATGYRFTETHRTYATSPKTGAVLKDADGNPEIVVTKVRKEVPPDTTAGKYWLNNRRKDRWREASRIEHTGPEGEPLSLVMNLGGAAAPEKSGA